MLKYASLDIFQNSQIRPYFEKIQSTPSYSYLRICLNTLMYVDNVFKWKYADTSRKFLNYSSFFLNGISTSVWLLGHSKAAVR